MYRLSAILIHKQVRPEGVIEVLQNRTFRSLHFGSSSVQSRMYLHDRQQLALSYTRAMMACLLFCEPRRVLLIGLGGGSLAKFLLHHFPDCRIDAVERDEAVVAVAQKYFYLPDDPRLRIVLADGNDFLRQTAEGAQRPYDLILVDAYDGTGMASGMDRPTFLQQCRDCLGQDGLFAINLWNEDPRSFAHVLDDLDLVFESRVLRLPVESKENVIAFGFNGSPLAPEGGLRTRAKTLQQRLDLELPALLRQLERHDGPRLRGLDWAR